MCSRNVDDKCFIDPYDNFLFLHQKSGLRKKHKSGLTMNYFNYNKEHSLCYIKIDCFFSFFFIGVLFLSILNIHFNIKCIS